MQNKKSSREDNKLTKVMVMTKVMQDTIIPLIEMEIMTKTLLEGRATLSNLKTSHRYNVSNVRSMTLNVK